jgi:hypothetical protein
MLIKLGAMIVMVLATYGFIMLIKSSPSLAVLEAGSLESYKEKNQKVFNLDNATIESLISELQKKEGN